MPMIRSTRDGAQIEMQKYMQDLSLCADEIAKCSILKCPLSHGSKQYDELDDEFYNVIVEFRISFCH